MRTLSRLRHFRRSFAPATILAVVAVAPVAFAQVKGTHVPVFAAPVTGGGATAGAGAAAGAGGAAAPTSAPVTPPMGGAGATNGAGASGGTGGSATGGATGKPATTTTPALGAGGKAAGDTGSLPQFESGVEFEPRNPNYKVAFSLEDADLPELVRVIGQLTGKRFIFGGKVRAIKASVYSPQKVTVAEAYQAFLSILETNGLTVVPHGRFLKIIETGGIASQTTPTYDPGESAPAEDRYVTRLHRLAHGSADDVANVLGHFKSKDGDITVYSPGNLLIITDTGSNIRRMMQIVEEVDVGASGDQMWIEPIHYASAADVASRLNDLFDLKGGGGAADAKGKPGAAPAGGADHVAKVVADERSNSVIIVASERAYLRMLEFIKRIDVPQSGEGEIHVLPLQHADAVELTKTLNDIIQGAGAAAQGGAAPAGGKGGAGAPQQVFEGGIKISADKATNSIVITSSLRDYASLRAVVDRLDQARRQVFIEAVIMDLSINRTDVLGVNFHAGALQDGSLIYGGLNPLSTILTPNPADLQGLALGVRGPGISGTENILGTGLSIPAFGVTLSALTTTGDADVLSTPHILATDNIKATISVGENVPRQTNIGGLPSTGGAPGTTGTAGVPGFGFGFGASPSFQDVGTKIEITPHLNESNEVRLELNEEISEAREAQGTLGVVPITKRTANTTLVVKDQQTVVIGGLMRNRITHSQQKIPVLGDIPVLGALFRKSTDVTQKTNLILVLTPYIIREQNDLRTIFERKMQERQEFLDRYFVFSDQVEYQPPKDYSRTTGLMEEIRASYRALAEQEKLDELTKPKDVKTHSPGDPIELPVGPRMGTSATGAAAGAGTTGAASGTTGPAAPNTAPPANINVSPQIRGVDRIER